MKLIFTKGTSPLSVLIRYGLSEPVSHFAIVFDDKFLIQSNLYGVGIKWFSTFKKHSEIVFELEYNLGNEVEEALYSNIMQNCDEAPYDFTAFFYFVYRVLLFRVLGRPIPKVSPYGNKNSFLCVELADQLPDFIYPKSHGLNITSPYSLFNVLSDQKNRAKL